MADEQLILSEMKVHKFSGDFPDVPTYQHVDTALLYEGDESPFHVTLEIARVGEVSEKGMVYDEGLVSEIEAQLPGLGGIRGHLKDSERGSAFPIEAIDWIGHQRVGNSLWAKAYVPPGQTREELRRRRARGGALATSIYGPYDEIVKFSGGKWKPRDLSLETIDLAPLSRASLKLGGRFNITSEMNENTEDNSMTDEQGHVISELTEKHTKLVSEFETLQIEHKTVVAELNAAFGEDWKAGMVAALAERDTLRKANLEAAIRAAITEKIELEALRPIVSEMLGVVDSKEAAENRISELLAREDVQRIAKALVAELAGPRAIVAPKTADGKKLVIDDEYVKNARNWAGF